MTASLRERTLNAGQWRVASNVLLGALQFAIGVLLARLLSPKEFGIAALALVVTGLATMVSDLGLGPAIVQRRDLTHRHLRVAFTTCLLFGLALAGALFMLAPVFGTVTHNEALPAVLRVQALLFIAAGAGTVAKALLQRKLDFRRLSLIDVASYVGGAIVAVGGAFSGWGVWSLVLGSVGQGLLSSAMSMMAVRVPVRPLLALSELRDLLGFGVVVSVNNVVNYLARSSDNFLVGRLLGDAALGLYARAYTVMMLPLNYVCSALPSVMQPALAEIQGDRKRVGHGFLMSVQLTAMTIVPIMAGLMVSAPHMIRGLYGPQWTGSVLPLQILCVVAFPCAVLSLAGAVNRACGRVRAELCLQIAYAAAVIVGAMLGARWGLAGVAVMVSLAIMLMYLAMARLALSITGETWRAFAVAQVPGVLLGLCTAAVVMPLRLALEHAALPSLTIFLVLLLGCAASLPLGVYLLPVRVRPVELFDHLRAPIRRLPTLLRLRLIRLLRTTT